MSPTGLDNRYMEFRLGDQLYALPLLSVKEVIQKPDITAVPNMATHFEGIINLRGQILGVFNVRKKLSANARTAAVTSSEVVVVIEQLGFNVGMIVDEVTRVVHPVADMIKVAPIKDNDPSRDFITSVIQTGDDLVLTIDVVRILGLEKYHLTKQAA